MKLNRILSISIMILILISIVFAENALSWSGTTHRILSNHGALNSVLKKDNYLFNYLGFQDGLGEIFEWQDKKQSVTEWMREGSELEDAGGLQEYLGGKARSFNHFHDPLKDWTNAGLDDYVYVLGFPVHVTGESSLVWAQDGKSQESYPEKDWSWKIARDLYYVALVSAAEEDRQAFFAMLFRGLGHQMHLIQDMAVPSHARNDAHPEQSLYTYNDYGELYFEPWAARNGALISTLAQIPRAPTVSLDEEINNYVPITQLTDANKYNGSNPSTSTDIGLAEYTNANYFSDDTIFASEIYPIGHRHYFPYPKKSSTDIQDFINGEKIPETIIAEDGIVDTGVWITKTGDGEQFPYFVRSVYLTNIIYKLFGEGSLFYSTFYRDEICHEDYAFELVPRAVGYSAALLDYFFRGKLEMAPSEDGEGYIIENKTEEDMDGTFELYYDDINNGRKQITSGDFPLNTTISANDKSDTVTFTPPDDAKEPDKYILVFQGRLGNEDDAVAGCMANPKPCGVFCVPTQTIFSVSIPTLGLDNGVCVAGGEILGLSTEGSVLARNTTLEIHHTGGGTFKINDIEITDHVWTYGTWYDQTGWPETWEVVYSSEFEASCTFILKQSGESDILFSPFVITRTAYSERDLAGGTYYWTNWGHHLHCCQNGKWVHDSSWTLYLSEENSIMREFLLCYNCGPQFLSDDFPSGFNKDLIPYPRYLYGAHLEGYSTQDCVKGVYCSGPRGLHVPGVEETIYAYSRVFIHRVKSYSFGGEEWEPSFGSLCPEDEGLTPTLCQIESPTEPPEGNPITISEFECYWKIEGSPLEELFLERGYPLLERQFGLQVTGVPGEVL